MSAARAPATSSKAAPTPVHIVAGFLGAGKTTTVRAWIAANDGRERAAFIVNDFGEAGIDAALISAGHEGQEGQAGTVGGVAVVNIPGGCVCCTAPAGLASAVATILDSVRPDRIFIEPSGLARPQDVVDMLTRGSLKDRVVLGPTLVIVDASLVAGSRALEGAATALLDTQLESADVLVLNRVDLATPDQLATFRSRIATLWPGPARVIETAWGVLPADALAWPDNGGSGAPAARFTVPKQAPSTDGFRARSWQFPAGVVMRWEKLRALLTSTADIMRFKGLFYGGDMGWFRVDVTPGPAGDGRVRLDGTAWRRDGRADLIVGPSVDLDAFAAALEACVLPEGEPSDQAAGVTGVTLVDLNGFELHLSRERLMALPGQVPDVSVVVPGRVGAGVLLSEVLALAVPPAQGFSGGPQEARVVVSAVDGLASAPFPLSGLGGTVLVHSLGSAPLPDKQGGPFRILVPVDQPAEGAVAEAGPSRCANVKGVARLRLLPGA